MPSTGSPASAVSMMSQSRAGASISLLCLPHKERHCRQRYGEHGQLTNTTKAARSLTADILTKSPPQ